MASQVGVGEVAIVPTLRGFRKAVTKETDASAKDAGSGFTRAFEQTGTTAGKSTGAGFKRAFDGQASGFSSKATRELEQSVAKSARALSAARLKEQDAAGKVRVAESQLAEARRKHSNDSSQVVRAEERLATATRQLGQAQDTAKSATDDLRTAQKRLAEAADDASDELAEAGSRGASRFTSGFREILAGSFLGTAAANLASNVMSSVTQAVGDGLRAAVTYIEDAVGLASGLEQAVGATDAVFKENAATISRWAKDAAQSVGLSESKYRGFAVVVGAQLKNMGIPLSDATTLTGQLLTLGADLAAQFGGPTSDAVAALSSLLRGERDPIERYGVSLKQADIDARLAAQGLSELEGEALKQAEAQAALALLMEQTGDAQGTFARRSGTLAGQLAHLTAEGENAQTKLGTSLLPTLTDLAKMANESLVPALNDIIDKVGPELADALADASPELIKLVEAIAESLPDMITLGAEALPVLIGAAQMLLPFITWLVEETSGWFTVVGGLFGLLSGDTSLATFDQSLRDTSGSLGWILDMVFLVADGIRGMGTIFSQVASGDFSWFQQKGQEIISFLGSLPARALNALGSVATLLVRSGRSLIQGFIDGIGEMLDAVGDAVGGVLEFARGFFPSSPAKRGPFSGSGWTALKKSGQATWQQYLNGFNGGDFDFPTPPPPQAGGRSSSSSDGDRGLAPAGDTYYFYGTYAPSAAELVSEVEKQKRRRVRRTGFQTKARTA